MAFADSLSPSQAGSKLAMGGTKQSENRTVWLSTSPIVNGADIPGEHRPYSDNQWPDPLSYAFLRNPPGVSRTEAERSSQRVADPLALKSQFAREPSEKPREGLNTAPGFSSASESSSGSNVQDQNRDTWMKQQFGLQVRPYDSLSGNSQQEVNTSSNEEYSFIPPQEVQDGLLRLRHHDTIRTGSCSSPVLDYKNHIFSASMTSGEWVTRGKGAEAGTETSGYSDTLLGSSGSQAVSEGFAKGTWSTPLWPTNAHGSHTQMSTTSLNSELYPTHAVQQTHTYPLHANGSRGDSDGDWNYVATPIAGGKGEKNRNSSSIDLRRTGRRRRQTKQQETAKLTTTIPTSTVMNPGTQSSRFDGARSDKGKKIIEKIVVASKVASNSEPNDPQTQVRHLCPHPQCDKHFSTGGHARRHSRIHSNAPRYGCPHPSCPATITRRDNCQQHQRNSHHNVLGTSYVQ